MAVGLTFGAWMWGYLVSVIDCCTREIVGWNLSHRCRTEEALDAVEQAVLERLPAGSRETNLTLTTDNGTQFTSSRFMETLARLGIAHRRTAYHHPEGNSYIERFHRSLKEEEVWSTQYKRTAMRRPIATLAMLLCRRMARCMDRRRQCGFMRAAAWAASTSKKRNKELPCLLMCPSRCLPALESSLGIMPTYVPICFPRWKRSVVPMINTKASAVSAPTPGWVINR